MAIVFDKSYFYAESECATEQSCSTVANRTELDSFQIITGEESSTYAIISSDTIPDSSVQLLWMVHHDSDSQPTIQSLARRASPLSNDVTFEVFMKGSALCLDPVGNAVCASGKIDRTADAWAAYGVYYLNP